ncbi:MAG: PspA/IM30 family protein [Granulosicoccus sp.]
MNLFTRISATIGATAETAVSRFENHDAIAQSALIEARQAVAKARIRHAHLTRSVEEIRKNLETAEKQVLQWTLRAQKLATTDEVRAMQCLEQRQISRQQVDNHLLNLCQHEDLAAGMAKRLEQMQTRLQHLMRQRDDMRSRESLARAAQVMDRIDSKGGEGVDAIFERWEVSIGDAEIHNDTYHDELAGVSTLQREMDEEERQAALKDELTALIEENKGEQP